MTNAAKQLEMMKQQLPGRPKTAGEVASRSVSGRPTVGAVKLPGDYEEQVELSLDDIEQLRVRHGLVSLDDLRTDHIHDAAERDRLVQAIEIARRYKADRREGPGLSFILVAGPVHDDPLRTGYGCGKTMIARALHHSLLYVNADSRGLDSVTLTPQGRFFEGRQLLAYFADEDFRTSRIIPPNCPQVVIDDVGREGVLRYVSNEVQLQEKQSRYYSIINYCYQDKISLVLTSNMRSKTLAEYLGGPTWSRLQQMAPAGYRWDMTGVRDYRPILGRHL